MIESRLAKRLRDCALILGIGASLAAAPATVHAQSREAAAPVAAPEKTDRARWAAGVAQAAAGYGAAVTTIGLAAGGGILVLTAVTAFVGAIPVGVAVGAAVIGYSAIVYGVPFFENLADKWITAGKKKMGEARGSNVSRSSDTRPTGDTAPARTGSGGASGAGIAR